MLQLFEPISVYISQCCCALSTKCLLNPILLILTGLPLCNGVYSSCCIVKPKLLKRMSRGLNNDDKLLFANQNPVSETAWFAHNKPRHLKCRGGWLRGEKRRRRRRRRRLMRRRRRMQQTKCIPMKSGTSHFSDVYHAPFPIAFANEHPSSRNI